MYGWFPEGAFVTRKHGCPERLNVVRSAASDAGRDPMAITPAAAAFVLTGLSRQQVDEVLETDAVKSAALLAPAGIWAAPRCAPSVGRQLYRRPRHHPANPR
jgi:phthiodiolone/phenolphthiodiolone dimycocerosates ketoreductase